MAIGDNLGLRAKVEAAVDKSSQRRITRDVETAIEDAEKSFGDGMDFRSRTMPSGGRGGGGAAAGAAGGGLLGGKIGGAAKMLGTVAIGGIVAERMLSAMVEASGRLRATASIFGQAFSLFWKPFGDNLGKWIQPLGEDILDMAIRFNKIASDESLSVAIGSIAKSAADKLGIGGPIEFTFGEVDFSIPVFEWADFIVNLVWGDWLDDLEWWQWIPPLDWLHWVSNLKWVDFVVDLVWSDYLNSLRWFDWIPPLTWADWVVNLPWEDWLSSLSWSDWVGRLSWSDWVGRLAWGVFVGGLSWSTWVGHLSWGVFVRGLTWGDWVPNLRWGSWIDDLSWSSWIPHLDWSDFISGFGKKKDPEIPRDRGEDARGGRRSGREGRREFRERDPATGDGDDPVFPGFGPSPPARSEGDFFRASGSRGDVSSKLDELVRVAKRGGGDTVLQVGERTLAETTERALERRTRSNWVTK